MPASAAVLLHSLGSRPWVAVKTGKASAPVSSPTRQTARGPLGSDGLGLVEPTNLMAVGIASMLLGGMD